LRSFRWRRVRGQSHSTWRSVKINHFLLPLVEAARGSVSSPFADSALRCSGWPRGHARSAPAAPSCNRCRISRMSVTGLLRPAMRPPPSRSDVSKQSARSGTSTPRSPITSLLGGSPCPLLGGSAWATLPGSGWATSGGSACPTPVAHYRATADSRGSREAPVREQANQDRPEDAGAHPANAAQGSVGERRRRLRQRLPNARWPPGGRRKDARSLDVPLTSFDAREKLATCAAMSLGPHSRGNR